MRSIAAADPSKENQQHLLQTKLPDDGEKPRTGGSFQHQSMTVWPHVLYQHVKKDNSCSHYLFIIPAHKVFKKY